MYGLVQNSEFNRTILNNELPQDEQMKICYFRVKS